MRFPIAYGRTKCLLTLVGMPASAAYVDAVTASEPVHYWRFDGAREGRDRDLIHGVDAAFKGGADLYEGESLLLADRLLLTQNENRLNAAKLVLLQAMNIEGESDIEIQPELINPEESERLEEMVSDSIFTTAFPAPLGAHCA